MRLIGTIEDQTLADRFMKWLESQNINARLESGQNKDWGSDSFGTLSHQVWVLEEDDVEKALAALQKFKENPLDTAFDSPSVLPFTFPSSSPKKMESLKQKALQAMDKARPPATIGPLTSFIVILCVAIFLIGNLTTPPFVPYPSNLNGLALFSPPVNQALFYDWPKKYFLTDQLASLYGIESLKNPSALPPEGQYLYNEVLNTPTYHGIYPLFVNWFQGKGFTNGLDAPLFEKIREGEIWRLVTPIFLHANFIHILFNLLWIIVLCRPMEERLRSFRLILFILIAAIISNTAQYLMSGPDFMGISGIVTAMLGYIWIRQREAPWEGYQIHPSTFGLLTGFIILLLCLQVGLFIFEVMSDSSFSVGIANTAHIAGALVGIVLGKLSFFSWQPKDNR